MNPIRVLIVDDDGGVRHVLKELLAAHGSFDVVAEDGTADDGIRLASELRPDVVTMDGEMPGRSGIDGTRVISTCGIPVVMLSGSLTGEAARRAGAVAAVAKTEIAAIPQVLAAAACGERP